MPYYVITLVKKVKIFRSNEIEYLYIGRHQDLDLAKSRGHIPANIKDSTLYMDFLISENQ